ncbi:MAG: polymer-forming cytoskeletal protein [Halobacteriovoraceae bacterium]|nr:polymer-forming cytoskeletal protein [Halobacteriovoraceae bacterium]MCB9095582.1 polymer-forming cytoskeletal protein [Halobacteriovoraceae bacterium]
MEVINIYDVHVFGQNSEFEGNFNLVGEVAILGNVSGEIIHNAQGLITIEPIGKFQGNLQCGDIVIRGKFQGILNSTGHVYIKSSAVVEGSINSQKLTVSPGAQLELKANSESLNENAL